MRQRAIFIAIAAIALALLLHFYFHRGPEAKDVEINVKEEQIAPGSLKFEGTIINTGAANISKVVVAADISELKFDDDALRGCKLEAPIAEIRNLRAGETRAVIWYFNQGEDQLRCGRPVHEGEAFTYKTDWSNFRWKVGVIEIE
jgi:hypothetical protein